MKRRLFPAHLTALVLALSTVPGTANDIAKAESPWCDSFSPNKTDLADAGKNPYFLLWPGYRLFLSDGNNTLVISVLKETKVIDGVRTRAVEERKTTDGKPTGVSRNYFAISRTTGDVYCFGKDVDTYENGKIAGHEGAWMSGVNGARLGLMMPGRPEVGDRYYQEVAPGTAMDRAEIVSLTEKLHIPPRRFEKCLRTRESSGLKPGGGDKWYAPDVGLIKNGNLVLKGMNCPICDGTQTAP